MAMVVRANQLYSGIGGHISDVRLVRDAVRGRLQPLLPRPPATASPATTSTSRATRRPASTRAPSSRAASAPRSCTPSAARSAAADLSSYPHPWLMPDFWEFPTVSMGLGPIASIYQARFNRYLRDRGIARHRRSRMSGRFIGDGETRRARDARRHHARRARAPRQPDLGHQLQPAAPRRARSAATARSSRSSRPSSAAPAGTSSR